MIAAYVKGRWSAFIAPSVTPRYETIAPLDGDTEHICKVYHDGEDELPNPQTMIGWMPESMWKSIIEYVDERHVADMEAKQ